MAGWHSDATIERESDPQGPQWLSFDADCWASEKIQKADDLAQAV